jgi:hypothetical protein
MGCDGGDIEPQPMGLLEKLRAAAAVRSGRPNPVRGRALPDRGPSHHHTPLRIVGELRGIRKLKPGGVR